MKFLVALLVGIALLTLAAWVGMPLLGAECARRSTPQYVDLVVPDGFRGGILVVRPRGGPVGSTPPRISKG